ncbi:hypothetical protein TNCV_3604721 [Trichonephila clavipes]|nr:hypothetical protein TNCV_3604721 [Trichonephila clavipes]
MEIDSLLFSSLRATLLHKFLATLAMRMSATLLFAHLSAFSFGRLDCKNSPQSHIVRVYDAGHGKSGVFHSAEWHVGDWSSDGIWEAWLRFFICVVFGFLRPGDLFVVHDDRWWERLFFRENNGRRFVNVYTYFPFVVEILQVE